jgi:hypothetical protein
MELSAVKMPRKERDALLKWVKEQIAEIDRKRSG